MPLTKQACVLHQSKKVLYRKIRAPRRKNISFMSKTISQASLAISLGANMCELWEAGPWAFHWYYMYRTDINKMKLGLVLRVGSRAMETKNQVNQSKLRITLKITRKVKLHYIWKDHFPGFRIWASATLRLLCSGAWVKIVSLWIQWNLLVLPGFWLATGSTNPELKEDEVVVIAGNLE